MDNFKAVYRILSSLEKAMDLPQFDLRQIDAKALGVSETRWARYLEMMADVGYIKGVCIQTSITGDLMVDAENIRSRERAGIPSGKYHHAQNVQRHKGAVGYPAAPLTEPPCIRTAVFPYPITKGG